jgi:dienelactone hydrolase
MEQQIKTRIKHFFQYYAVMVCTMVFAAVTNAAGLPKGNPFSAYLDGKAPEIVKEIQPWTLDEKWNVLVRKVVVRAREIPDSPEGHSDILVILAKPKAEGQYPGLLHLHGGGGYAQEGLAKVWAKQGYIVAAPDLPGIANHGKVPHSTGPIRRAYDKSRWTADPDVTASSLFDGIVAGIKTFYMLKNQPDVIPGKLGITGVSWGGYTTTMLCGLLGDEVKAAVSVWGAGFYDAGSVFKKSLAKMPENKRELWLQYLDAGRYAHNIQCNMMFFAATNDRWFYPPCVMKTYDAVSAPKVIVWAPNDSHYARAVAGGSKSPKRRSLVGMETYFLDYFLKDKGDPITAITVAEVKKADAGLDITAKLKDGEAVENVTLWYAPVPANGDWPNVKWEDVPCQRNETGQFTGTLPTKPAMNEMAWFITASEKDRAISTPMRQTGE